MTAKNEAQLAPILERLNRLSEINEELGCGNEAYVLQAVRRLQQERDELQQWQDEVVAATRTSNRARALQTIRTRFATKLGPEWDKLPSTELCAANGIDNPRMWALNVKRLVQAAAEESERLQPDSSHELIEGALEERAHGDIESIEDYLKSMLQLTQAEAAAEAELSLDLPTTSIELEAQSCQ